MLRLLQAEKLSKAQAQFDATWKKYQDAIDVLPEEDRGKKLKPIQVCLLTALTQTRHPCVLSKCFCRSSLRGLVRKTPPPE